MQITTPLQALTISNNPQNPDIDVDLRKVSKENSLPSIGVIHYANMWFNLFNDPKLPFLPSPEVKQQLYYAAHSRRDQYGIHLGEGFNYTNLSASDTAALFYILNSFQAYEKEKEGEVAIFPEVAFYFEQYILGLCQTDEYKAQRVLDALISYNNPSNHALIEKMRSSITAIAKTNPAHHSTGQNQFSLPEDIWLEIFKKYLSPKDLASVALVCKQFRILANSNYVWNAIEKRLPSLYSSPVRVIGPEVWKEYVDLAKFGLSLKEPVSAVEGAAPGSKRASLIPILTMLHQVAPKVEENAGITVLTIPEGLTFNKLVEIAGSPKQDNQTGFGYIWDRITQELGDIPVTKTYRVVITNNVLRGSRNESFAAQQALGRDLGCELPGVLEASTLCILTNIIFSTRLCGVTPWTYTRCWQKIDRIYLVVGGFGPAGLNVYFDDFDHDIRGALVLRKFPVIGT